MLSLEIQGKKVDFIGDPHLGKKFGGVPLHRTGEREALQISQFQQELNNESDVVIMVGDLFDTFIVSNEVLLQAFDAITEARDLHPKKIFIFISGNHDISRDADVLSSFHVLKKMLEGLSRVQVYMEPNVFVVDSLKILLVPYSMFDTAEKAIEKYKDKVFDLVVGHWDTLEIAGPHNLMPYKTLASMTTKVVSGHEHTPYILYIDKEGNHGKQMGEPDAIVYGTGSMQPYSHGEDPEQTLYITRTLEQVIPALAQDPHAYKDKCVRLVLGPDEVPPPDFDCLQFSIKRVTSEQKEELEVTLGEFSFRDLFFETFQENDVPEEIIEHYYEQYKQKANDDN